ncbi:MAG: WYL domain-containing protein [Clostridia bacterium]|nr:WYL domain-containing protein [Clostridia bacterium]
MKFAILAEMLFDLLTARKVTASFFSEKFGLSPRTVYRYIDALSACVPVQIQRGRNGGILLSDSYKLPKNFMTKDEYDAAIEAIGEAYAHSGDERFLSARRKLSAQIKTETRDLAHSLETGAFLTDGGVWGDDPAFAETLRVFEECIKERTVAELDGERRIEPHALLFRKGVWYVYAFRHTERDFGLFRLADIRSVVKTQELFRRRPFAREDIPLDFRTKETQTVRVRLEIADEALERVQTKLGADRIRVRNGKRYAEAELPDDDALAENILGMGAGVKVVKPESLRDRVKTVAQTIAKQYE